MANYKVVDADKLDAAMTSVADAIRAKSGTDDSLAFPDGFVSAVEGIQAGEEIGYGTNGMIYIENVVVPDYVTTLTANVYAANGFKSVYAPEVTALDGHYCFGRAWNSMQRIICPKLQSWGSVYWCYGGDLKEVQAGSIGFPVSDMPFEKGFGGNNNTDLVITIYVDATALSEVPTDISNYAPFGAINTTIIYRNSTTGEVITE